MLGNLVENILDHAKIEQGLFEIQEETFKFENLFDEIHDIFNLQTERGRIKIEFSIDEALKDLNVKTDKGRIKQILINLISNASKFTDRGSIKVKLSKHLKFISYIDQGMVASDRRNIKNSEDEESD